MGHVKDEGGVLLPRTPGRSGPLWGETNHVVSIVVIPKKSLPEKWRDRGALALFTFGWSCGARRVRHFAGSDTTT